jgi:hypothetical protein
MKSFRGVVKFAWYVHMLSTHLASVHATVSQVFGSKMSQMYGVPVNGLWPPILWSPDFQADPSEWTERASAKRSFWLEELKKQGCVPKAIMLSAGRWSAEKRIHLLIAAVPDDCALVIVGDGTAEAADRTAAAGMPNGRRNVLPLRKMLSAKELRVAYGAADLFLSASNFETLGNTIIESMSSGTPCAVQPAQGHLEFVKDQVNSWFVNYDNSEEAKATLTRIVATGLASNGTSRLKAKLPELISMGEKFRTLDFPRDFERNVIEPAIATVRSQSSGSFLKMSLETGKRISAFILCVLLWFFFRMVTRMGFVFCRDPEVEVLGPLGTATDDKRAPSVLTFPCMRPFAACFAKLCPVKLCPVDQQTATPASRQVSSDGTDFASHFESARKPWWNRRL